jgi:hypothetical protein
MKAEGSWPYSSKSTTGPYLSQINTPHNLPLYFFKISIIIALPFTRWSSQWSVSFKLYTFTQNGPKTATSMCWFSKSLIVYCYDQCLMLCLLWLSFTLLWYRSPFLWWAPLPWMVWGSYGFTLVRGQWWESHSGILTLSIWPLRFPWQSGGSLLWSAGLWHCIVCLVVR